MNAVELSLEDYNPSLFIPALHPSYSDNVCFLSEISNDEFHRNTIEKFIDGKEMSFELLDVVYKDGSLKKVDKLEEYSKRKSNITHVILTRDKFFDFVDLLEGIDESSPDEMREVIEDNPYARNLATSVQHKLEAVINQSDLTLPEVAPVLFIGEQKEALDFLEEHYGQYLSYFGAKKNILFQYQLKNLDENLFIKVKNRISYLYRRGELSANIPDIIPPISKETDFLIEKHTGRVRNLGLAINTRKHRDKP